MTYSLEKNYELFYYELTLMKKTMNLFYYELTLMKKTMKVDL